MGYGFLPLVERDLLEVEEAELREEEDDVETVVLEEGDGVVS